MNQLDEKIQIEIFKAFKNLPLRDKLIVYAKVVHGNLFRVSKNDLLSMNKRNVSRVHRSFISSLKPLAKKSKKRKKKVCHTK